MADKGRPQANSQPAKSAAPPGPGGKGMTKKVRSSIQAAIDEAKEIHKRELWKRRVDLARTGVRNYRMKRIGEAVRAFHTYIKILEDWKGVPEGGLTPQLFDIKKDLPELVLINGIYWDLVKLYDRTASNARHKDFLHYLEKYIIFSKGMPFQPLSAESLRKYVRNSNPVQKEEFKNAYRMITGGSICFVATSLMDVCDLETLPRLREFRDVRLSRHAAGRAFIRWYYRNGPWMADLMDRTPQSVRMLTGRLLDFLSRIV
jgi:hypothetical protein